MPRLLTSLLVVLLGAWPAPATASSPRLRRTRRRPSRSGTDEDQDAVEAPERARTTHVHHWAGEAVFRAGDREAVVPGRWSLTLNTAQRAQAVGSAGHLSLDPAYPEAWETQLESLLMLQVPGTRLRVNSAGGDGWHVLELRAPTLPETVVQLDRAAVAQVMDCAPHELEVELRVLTRD